MKTIDGISIIAIITALTLLIVYLIGGYFVISELQQKNIDVMLPFFEKVTSVNLIEKVTSVNLIENNTLIAQSPVCYPEPRVYASLSSQYDELIKCLIRYESSGNPRAYNEFDPTTESIGILQFKRATYQHFCIDRYGLPDDIWDPNLQRKCCENMLNDNLGFHWTTYSKCVN